MARQVLSFRMGSSLIGTAAKSNGSPAAWAVSKPTSKYMKNYFIHGQKAAKSLADLYANVHHTGTTNEAQGDVHGRMSKILGAVPTGH